MIIMKSSFIGLLTLLFAVFSCLPAFSENEANAVFVEQKDGSLSTFLFSDKPVITFTSDQFQVNAGEALSLSFGDVKKVYFSYAAPTKIGSDKIKESIRITDGQTVEILGQPNVKVSVFSINGMKMPVSVSRRSDGASFSINDLPLGVYIIKTDLQSFKIMKR